MKIRESHFKNTRLSTFNLDERTKSPFVGPRPFDRKLEDQERFFGRDDENTEIVSLIASHKLVLIYAQSGAGKTSLFNAQVIPSLEKEEYDVLPVTRVKSLTISTDLSPEKKDPTDIKNIYIFNSLQIIKNSLKNLGLLDKSLPDTSLSDKSLSHFLQEYCPLKKDKHNNYKRQVLIFDQLEEIFDIFPRNWQEQREDFFNQVAIALEDINLLQIVFVIREDYLAQLDPYSNFLPEKLRPRFRLERLREESALLAVKEPIETMSKDSDPNYFKEQEEDIKKIIKELKVVQVEYFPGKTHPIEGEFVEPIQLQVVFKRWWEKMIKSDDKSTKQNKINVTDVDDALEDFYEKAIFEVINQTKISERRIRNWCEENLITLSGTRSIVHRSLESTAGMDNEAIDILTSNYLIKENWLAGSRWYELIHDRLIKPIQVSNRKWRTKYEKRKRLKILRIAIPLTISILIVAVVFSMWYNDQYIIKPIESISVGELPYLQSVDQKKGLVYVTNPKTDTISIINGKRNSLVASISVQDEPTDIEVDSNNELIYISHPYEKMISVIQGSTHNNIKNIPLNYSPLSIDLNSENSKLYVTALGSPIVSVIDTNNFTTIENITVGNGPTGIIVDPLQNKVYVANSEERTISVINGTTNKVESNITVGNGPASISINSKTSKVYVANIKDNTVSVIDGKKDQVINIIKVGMSPFSLGIDPNDNQLYVVNHDDSTISVIDETLGMVVANLNVGNKPTSIDINTNENILYVVNNLDNNIIAIDIDEDLTKKYLPITVLSHIPVGIHPSGIAINNYTQMIYVANTDSDSISVINGITNMKVNEIEVGEKPRDMDIDNKNSLLYVSNSLSDSISIINTTQVGHIHVKKIPTQGKYPTGLSFNDETNLVYVANTDSNTVSVINGTTHKVDSLIKVGNGPSGIAVDTKNNLVYVTNSHTNTVSVINGTTHKVESNITVGNGPSGIAVDTKNNLIYVTNYEDDSVSVIKRTINVGNIHINGTHKGNGPTSLVVNPDNNKLYILNFFTDNISILDIDIIIKDLANSGKLNKHQKYVTTSINAGNSPIDLSLNTNTKKIYITDREENLTKVIKI